VKELLSNPNTPNLLDVAGIEKLIVDNLPIEWESACVNLISPYNSHTTIICRNSGEEEPIQTLMLPVLGYARPWLPDLQQLLNAHLNLSHGLSISPYFYEYSGPLIDVTAGIQGFARIKVGLEYNVNANANIMLNDYFEEKVLAPRVVLLLPYSIRSLKFYVAETGRFKFRICCIKTSKRYDYTIVCLSDEGCTLEVEDGVSVRGPHLLLRGKCSGEMFRRALILLLYSKLISIAGARKPGTWLSISSPGLIVAARLGGSGTVDIVLWNVSLSPHTIRLKLRGYRIAEAFAGVKKLEPVVPNYDEVYITFEGLELKRVRLKVRKLPPLLMRRLS